MTVFRTLIALSVTSLVAACASPGAMHAAPGSTGMPNMSAASPVTTMEPRMQAMQDMGRRDQMMADHMAMMQMMMDMMADRMPGAPASK